MVSRRCSWQLDGDALMSPSFFKQLQKLLLTTVGGKITRLAARTSASKLAAQKLSDGLEGRMARVTALSKRSAVYICRHNKIS